MRTEIHFEICTEDEQGFNPIGVSYASRQEAEEALPTYRKRWGAVFVVRTTMTRVDQRQAGKLRAV